MNVQAKLRRELQNLDEELDRLSKLTEPEPMKRLLLRRRAELVAQLQGWPETEGRN